MLNRHLLAFSALLLVGCAPTWETYFRPSAEEAIEIHKCGGPVREIAFEFGTGRLSLRASRQNTRPDLISLRFTFVPAWAWEDVVGSKSLLYNKQFVRKVEQSALRMTTEDLEVLLTQPDAKERASFKSASLFDYQTQKETPLPLQSTLEVTVHATKNFSKSEVLGFMYEFPIGVQKEFTVFMPDFLVDGIIYKGRQVHFIESSSVWITPINGC